MSEENGKKTLFQKIQLWVESQLLGKHAALDRPGWFLKYFFKMPIFMWKIGLGEFVGPYYLLITTRGRKSGKWRDTPLEFSRHKLTNEPVIISGWAYRSDWVKNLLADPRLQVRVGRQRYNAIAIPLSLEECADTIEEYTTYAPTMKKVFERWSQVPLDGTRQSLLENAKFFPCFRLQKGES